MREAGVEAIKELMVSGMEIKPMVTNEHFKKAITKIRPSVTERVSFFPICTKTYIKYFIYLGSKTLREIAKIVWHRSRYTFISGRRNNGMFLILDLFLIILCCL